MSLSGWAPWLIDQTEPDPAAFTTYTRQLSVLLPAGRRRPRELPAWRAWLPSRPAFRACPQCIATSTPPYPYQLLWLLSLTLSCPFHGCLLEPRAKAASYFSDWERKPPTPRPASATVLAMDSGTWHAMTTGSVDLPRRQVHAGTWFRLIRTIIDELGATPSECRTAGRVIRRICKETGYPLRAGPLSWRPHEDYPLDVQLHTPRSNRDHHLPSGKQNAHGPWAGRSTFPALRRLHPYMTGIPRTGTASRITGHGLGYLLKLSARCSMFEGHSIAAMVSILHVSTAAADFHSSFTTFSESLEVAENAPRSFD
jgi:hypothetical protein